MIHSPAPPLTQSALDVNHKMIRRELFKTSSLLAQTESDGIGPIQEQIQAVAALLRSHANHEDQAFEALLRDYDPVFANILEDDHLKLEADLEQLLQFSQTLNQITVSARQTPLQQLYLDWNRFVGHYLLHMDDEERRLFTVIREHKPALSMIRHSINTLKPKARKHFISNLKEVTTFHEQQHILGDLGSNGTQAPTQMHDQHQKEPA